MFSSTSSMNPSPSLSSSYNLHFPPAFAGYDCNTAFLDHQHDPLTGLLLPANPRIIESLTNKAFVDNNAAMIKQNFDRLKGDCYGPSNLIPGKKPVRKDRHSKICTAQGYRDRRVRLSIEIAREFFDLQDMLGFDTPSKTLEWLLNKSSQAIGELAELKQMGNDGGNKSFYPVSDQEVVYENGVLEGNGSRSKPFGAISEEKNIEKLRKTALQLLAKESRDKARARARKRTREKLRTRRLQDCKKVRADSSPQIFTPVSSLSQFKACEESSSYPHDILSSLNIVAHEAKVPCSHELANQAAMEVVDEQGSNVIERKQNTSPIFAYQLINLEISRDITSNNSNYHCNSPQNWDTNTAMAPQSTFWALTNMNLSNGLQIHGKPCWEPRNSLCQL